MDINFEYYKVFYYAAKYKNLTRAAAAMGTNQPNVTRIMKLLEEQLGCKLFVREARGVCLTKEGELLFSHVDVAFRQFQVAQEELFAKTCEEKGIVEIGATETALHLFLLQALQQLKLAVPGACIKIHNHTTPDIIKNLKNGRFDFAIVTSPYTIEPEWEVAELLRFREILVGGPTYRRLSETKHTLEELAACDWVGLGRETATYGMYQEFFYQQHVDIMWDTEVASSDLLLPLIQNNLGIGFVPEQMAQDAIQNGELFSIGLSSAVPVRQISLICDKGRGESLIANRCKKFLRGYPAKKGQRK